MRWRWIGPRKRKLWPANMIWWWETSRRICVVPHRDDPRRQQGSRQPLYIHIEQSSNGHAIASRAPPRRPDARHLTVPPLNTKQPSFSFSHAKRLLLVFGNVRWDLATFASHCHRHTPHHTTPPTVRADTYWRTQDESPQKFQPDTHRRQDTNPVQWFSHEPQAWIRNVFVYVIIFCGQCGLMVDTKMSRQAGEQAAHVCGG